MNEFGKTEKEREQVGESGLQRLNWKATGNGISICYFGGAFQSKSQSVHFFI